MPEDKQDTIYHSRCDIRKIDKDSNVFIGLDQQNAKNLAVNVARLKSRNELLENRIRRYNNGLRKGYSKLKSSKG